MAIEATDDQIKTRLIALIEHDVGVSMGTYQESDSLTRDVGFDASRLADFAAEINHDFKRFKAQFFPKEMGKYDKIGDLIAELLKRIHSASPPPASPGGNPAAANKP